MGPNYLRFLEAIEASGTIREAGKVVGWSYRTCLNRIQRLENRLGRPVVLTSRGGRGHGGARLSAEVRRVIRAFAAWETQMAQAADRVFGRGNLRLRGRVEHDR